MPTLILTSAVLISFSLVLTSNDFLHFFSYCYSLAVFGYFIYSACGNTVKKGFADLIVADFFKALIIMPFCSFNAIFKAMFTGKRKESNKTFLMILLGISLTIVPTMVVFGLLSYDSDFTSLLKNIFDFKLDKFWSHLGSLILGVPLGMYFYGLFISSVDNKCKNVLNEKSSATALKNIRIAPLATVVAATIPLLFLYVVFFISQWQYYISGFTNILPLGFNHASYAREGFFQLCAVAVINLIVITAVILFLKRNNKANKILLKVVVLMFSVSTLILISTAVAKMAMYINNYGLTPKRVYSTWFMILIAFIFILISVKMFVKKLKVVALTFVISVVMFAVISIPNADAFIARYNVNRYIDGTLQSVDLETLDELGSSAIPSLIELDEYISKQIKNDTYSREQVVLDSRIEDYFIAISADLRNSERTIFSYTIPDKIAQHKLKEIGYF